LFIHQKKTVMKIEVKDGEIILKEVFSGVGLETDSGETMGICMRDSGFEFNYGGKWYEAKGGRVSPTGCSDAPDATPLPDVVPHERPPFSDALTTLINQYSMENGSNTPDFILSEFLIRCLQSFDEVTKARTTWYLKEEMASVKQPA
jgi:hypothetical protein